MVDYRALGTRIRTVRQSRKMTQEQLANIVGVGVTHISHIETGNTVPSLQVLIDIINALQCSADELLCLEVEKAAPRYHNWMVDLVSDCNEREIKLITDMVIALKNTMRRLEI